MKQHCDIIFPGKFKPVHSGHIMTVLNALNTAKYDSDVHIIISRVDKDGLSADTSKWFLDKIFQGNPRVSVEVSADNSPIKTFYDTVRSDRYESGMYAIVSSTKGNDMARVQTAVDMFAPGGEYYNENITLVHFADNHFKPLTYSNGVPISSTSLRSNLKRRNYKQFKDGYKFLLDRDYITEDTLLEYYKKLVIELAKNESACSDGYEHVNEGGAAGHMSHPYEMNDMTFGDLKQMTKNLFYGEIDDITEKLDGMNIFASMSDSGEVVFARNKSTLINPMSRADLSNHFSEHPNIQKSFDTAADVISKVLRNIKSSVFFSDDTEAGVAKRVWVNFEIIDPENRNVILYTESIVSVNGFSIVTNNYKDPTLKKKDRITVQVLTGSNSKKYEELMQAAIAKTDKTVFQCKLPQKIFVKKVDDCDELVSKFNSRLDDIMKKYSLEDSDTILDYKASALRDLMNTPKFKFITGDVADMLLRRWSGAFNERLLDIKKATLSNGDMLTPEQYMTISDFDKNGVYDYLNQKMKPIDNWCIQLGNAIIRISDGFVNNADNPKVITKIISDLKQVTDEIDKTDDIMKKDKLKKCLMRFNDANNQVNSTEGIVINYKGHVIKLTGTFAPLNAALGIIRYSR